MSGCGRVLVSPRLGQPMWQNNNNLYFHGRCAPRALWLVLVFVFFNVFTYKTWLQIHNHRTQKCSFCLIVLIDIWLWDIFFVSMWWHAKCDIFPTKNVPFDFCIKYTFWIFGQWRVVMKPNVTNTNVCEPKKTHRNCWHRTRCCTSSIWTSNTTTIHKTMPEICACVLLYCYYILQPNYYLNRFLILIPLYKLWSNLTFIFSSSLFKFIWFFCMYDFRTSVYRYTVEQKERETWKKIACSLSDHAAIQISAN